MASETTSTSSRTITVNMTTITSGEDQVMFGVVFKITINGNLHFLDNDVSHEFYKEYSDVKIFASSYFYDAFATDLGTVWNLNINGVAIKGTCIHTNCTS